MNASNGPTKRMPVSLESMARSDGELHEPFAYAYSGEA
jgi:hypothetical protein